MALLLFPIFVHRNNNKKSINHIEFVFILFVCRINAFSTNDRCSKYMIFIGCVDFSMNAMENNLWHNIVKEHIFVCSNLSIWSIKSRIFFFLNMFSRNQCCIMQLFIVLPILIFPIYISLFSHHEIELRRSFILFFLSLSHLWILLLLLSVYPSNHVRFNLN